MQGETNLQQLLTAMQPELQEGNYVFCSIASTITIEPEKIIGYFKEKEGLTIIVEQALADQLQLSYSFVAA